MTKENVFGSGVCALFSHLARYSAHEGGSHCMNLEMAGVMHAKTSGASAIWSWLSCNLGHRMTIIVSAYQRPIIRERKTGENTIGCPNDWPSRARGQATPLANIVDTGKYLCASVNYIGDSP